MLSRTVPSLDLIVSSFVLVSNDTEMCPEVSDFLLAKVTLNVSNCRVRVLGFMKNSMYSDHVEFLSLTPLRAHRARKQTQDVSWFVSQAPVLGMNSRSRGKSQWRH